MRQNGSHELLALSNVRIFDGADRDLSRAMNVFVAGERIHEISDRPPSISDGEIIDGQGYTLMPGMIDAHVHVCALSANPADGDAAPETLLAGWASWMMGRMLDRGFTTVRDVGGADYGLHMALERGWIRGPRLFFSGRALCQTGGAFDLRNPRGRAQPVDTAPLCGCTYVNQFAYIADGVDAVRRAARENIRRGSNFIKFMASGDVTTTGSRFNAIEYSDDEIRAIVDEVERQQLYCTAHAHGDNAIRRAIKLGVHCIEHGSLISPETARMAADAGTAIVPTLAVISAFARRGDEVGLQDVSRTKLANVTERVMECLAGMKEAGVTIGFGTDLLGTLEDEQCQEFALRLPIFSPYEMLVQATSGNARIIGAQGELGVVKVGALADLLIVRGNPLSDIGLLAAGGDNLELIIQRGKVVLTHAGRSWPRIQ